MKITYINRIFDGHEVEAEISVYSIPGKVSEYHVMLHGRNNLLSYNEQLHHILGAYKTLLTTGINNDKVVPVLTRYFLSDAANQSGLLHRSLTELPPAAVSVVQQPPVDGTKISMWIYLLSNAVDMAVSDTFFSVSHNSYVHYWTGNRKIASGNSETQTLQLLEQYEQDLAKVNNTISANCIRTWFFVQNVDVNYMGLVKARRENFTRVGLTEKTHYITSTGIEGRDADPAVHVLLDAYAVNGIDPRQVNYLYALTHLSPTNVYGVTFERGVSVTYGDRKQLYISGTASINDKGEVLHVGDVVKQTYRMWENVGELLREGGATFSDLAQIIVYLRDASDYALVQPLFKEHFSGVPIQFVLAPVCRPTWLIEMECIAIIDSGNPEFDDF